MSALTVTVWGVEYMVIVTVAPGVAFPRMVGLFVATAEPVAMLVIDNVAEAEAASVRVGDMVGMGVGLGEVARCALCVAFFEPAVDPSPVMVMVAGVVPINTLVAPSPMPPTNVFGAKRTVTGDSVLSSVLNRTTAIDPATATGLVAETAPTVMDAVPRSI